MISTASALHPVHSTLSTSKHTNQTNSLHTWVLTSRSGRSQPDNTAALYLHAFLLAAFLGAAFFARLAGPSILAAFRLGAAFTFLVGAAAAFFFLGACSACTCKHRRQAVGSRVFCCQQCQKKRNKKSVQHHPKISTPKKHCDGGARSVYLKPAASPSSSWPDASPPSLACSSTA